MAFKNAAQVIRAEFGSSTNMMAPNRIKVGWVIPGKLAYELAGGEGLRHEPIFGLSLVHVKDDGSTERDHENGGCFYSRREVDQRIAELACKGHWEDNQGLCHGCGIVVNADTWKAYNGESK